MSITIQLEESAFAPGSEVRGRVEWQAEVEEPETVVISLLWYTEGKGTEDIQIVDQTEIKHPIPVSGRDFSFRLPDFPWSFSGTLISLVWAVEASVEPEGAVAREVLIAAPDGEEVRI